MDGDLRMGAEAGVSADASSVRKSVLLIGASSLVGRRLCELLRSPGFSTKYEASFTSRWRNSCKTLCLDLTRPQSFKPEGRYESVIICSPIWLVSEAAIMRLKEVGMQRLIVFSSTSRFTKTQSAQDAERKVVQDLIDGEEVVTRICQREGIGYTILRPTLIYDEGRDQNVSKILKVIDKIGLFVVCGRARGLRQPVHARDLAKAAVQALQSETALNKAYNLSGGETLTYRDMVARIFAARSHKPRIISMPGAVWKAGFGMLNLFRPKHKLKLNAEMAIRMNADMAFDHAEATHDFGYAPQNFVLDGFEPRPSLFECPMSKAEIREETPIPTQA